MEAVGTSEALGAGHTSACGVLASRDGTVWHGCGQDPKDSVDLVLMLEATNVLSMLLTSWNISYTTDGKLSPTNMTSFWG